MHTQNLLHQIEGSIRQDDLRQVATLLEMVPASGLSELVAYEALANILQDEGSVAGAALLYRHLVALCPDNADAHYNLGNVLRLQGHVADAAQAFRQVLLLDDEDVCAHQQLGNLLLRMGHVNEAITHFRAAITSKPDFHEVYVDLGNALKAQGNGQGGIDCYRRALEINPAYLLAQYNLGVALMEAGDLEQAIDCYRRVFDAAPDFVEARWNCAHCLLTLGSFEEGWALFESRLAKPSVSPPHFFQLRWTGDDLRGRRILVCAEQGFGDTLQFVRYLPLLRERYHAAMVTLACQPELARLLQSVPGVSQVIAGDGDCLPDFDVHIPLLSLPYLFHTTLDTIPNNVPYVYVSRILADSWEKRFAGDPRKKIGLAWAGRATHSHDARRSLAPTFLSPLLARRDISFVSLQKENADTDLHETHLLDYSKDLSDFADTAGLIAQLDLVITVDTAVAHLAGAMGVPVWLLIAFEGEWRWLRNRSDSPWYPSMTLFRQSQSGCWDNVLARIATGLDQVAAAPLGILNMQWAAEAEKDCN